MAWFDDLYQEQLVWWQSVYGMMLLMVKAGLKLPEDRAGLFDIDDPETIAVYLTDFMEAGITAEDIKLDGQACRQGFRFFPSSGELVGRMRLLKERRKPSNVIHEPVCVIVDGEVRITSKDLAEGKRQPWFKDQWDAEIAAGLREPTPKALLPRKGESFSEYMERRGVLTESTLAEDKRMPSARQVDTQPVDMDPDLRREVMGQLLTAKKKDLSTLSVAERVRLYNQKRKQAAKEYSPRSKAG